MPNPIPEGEERTLNYDNDGDYWLEDERRIDEKRTQPDPDPNVIAWAVRIWRDLHPEQRTDQKWRDLITAVRSLSKGKL